MTHSIMSIGIDVAKKKLDVAALFNDQRVTSRVVPNTAEGINELIRFLKTQKVAEATPCVIESTGDFHLLVSIMLTREGFTVNCINPLITKRYQRASVRNAKTDRIDAKRLADIGVLEAALPVFSAQTNDIFVKRVIAFISMLEKTKQRLAASLRHLREVEAVLGTEAPVAHTVQAIGAIEQQIAALEQFVSEHVDRAEELAELRGISKAKAAQLLGALGTTSFASRDALVAFAGLDVAPRVSGTWRGKEKLSKRGDPHLRKLLFRMAWGLKQHNETYRAYYEKLRVDGKHYTTCLIAVARKFLRYVYAVFFRTSGYPQVAG